MPLAWRDDRQQNMRRAGFPDEDTVTGDARLPPRPFRLARIRIDVEMREIAARDVKPQVLTAEQLATGNNSMVIA